MMELNRRELLDEETLAQVLAEEMVRELEAEANPLIPQFERDAQQRFNALANVVERFNLTDRVKPITLAKARELWPERFQKGV